MANGVREFVDPSRAPRQRKPSTYTCHYALRFYSSVPQRRNNLCVSQRVYCGAQYASHTFEFCTCTQGLRLAFLEDTYIWGAYMVKRKAFVRIKVPKMVKRAFRCMWVAGLAYTCWVDEYIPCFWISGKFWKIRVLLLRYYALCGIPKCRWIDMKACLGALL